jgi:hypothetical protein
MLLAAVTIYDDVATETGLKEVQTTGVVLE